MLGEFLEISVHSDDVLESLRFYERLGFTQVATNDAWTHPYGVVTDGRCVLGIHAFEFPGPSLTFAAPGLRKRVEPLEAAGAEFEFLKLGDDEFHELGFFMPDEQIVTLLEARTFTPPPPAGVAPALTGFFAEYLLPVEDRAFARDRWLAFGMIENDAVETLHDTASLCCTGLNIGLTESRQVKQPALVFHVPDLAHCLAELEPRGIVPLPERRGARPPAAMARLQAPEGTPLWLMEIR